MVNTSTQTLQIKTSGFNLPDIKTINIAIIYPEGTINKKNSDIEIDNDVLIVFLTQEESENLKENGASISISATDCNNVDVSNRIRIIWVKKGNRSSTSTGDSFVSKDDFEQTISNVDTKVEDLENSLSIGNGRIYLDYQDGKYGVNTDPDRGADTFSPFKADKGVEWISSPLVIQMKFSGTHFFTTSSNTLDLRNYFPTAMQGVIKKIVIKTMNIKRSNTSASKGSVYFEFKIYGLREGATSESIVYSNSWSTRNNYTYVDTSYLNDVEIDTSLFKYVTGFGVYSHGKVATAISAKSANYDFWGRIEVYL